MMKNWLVAFLALCVLCAPSARAQQARDTDALVAEMAALMNQRGVGFRASQSVLAHSFAAWLHGPDGPRSVADLSSRRAHYDPIAPGNRLTAGMLYFHLARPIAIFRELGGGPNEVFARIMEIRLRWLSGNSELALAQAEELIGLMDDPDAGWSDPEMVSLLADAAVLSWRLGRPEAAERYFQRAMACGEPRCPTDLIFGWLGPERKDSKDRFAGYDPQTMSEVALAGADRLFPGDDRVPEDIRLETALMQGDPAPWRELLRAAPADLTPDQRRRARVLADRLQAQLGLVNVQMGSDSVAFTYRTVAMARLRQEDLSPEDLGETDYLSEDNPFTEFLYQNVPILYAVLERSDMRGDDVVAELIRLRLILADGDLDRGLEGLLALIRTARADGYSDAELFSVLMDAWAVARRTGDRAVETRMASATQACRSAPCHDDLALRFFFDWAEAAPKVPPFNGFKKLARSVADPFLRTTFAGDLLKLADLYQTGTGGAGDRPMDAAQDDLLSIGFAEAATDIAPEDLVRRAASAMNTLVYAGKYADAAALGDRIEKRLTEDGADSALSAWFYRYRARAAFHLGEDRARAFYERAVDRALNEHARNGTRISQGLVLDLFDTDFHELLERLLTAVEGYPGIRARLHYRLGRPDDAAAILADARHAIARQIGDVLVEFLSQPLAGHLRGGNLDAYVAGRLRAERVAAGDVPVEHHHFYARFWDLRVMAFQEAFYREAAGDPGEARRLRALGGPARWYTDDWTPLSEADENRRLTAYQWLAAENRSSYDLIRDVIEARDEGYFEAASRLMTRYRWVALAAEENGAYVDAQTLWQMAFTFLRGGEAGVAFDLMDRAARIAARLSFEGAGGADGGTLQLLERDRWRYLLFVDIAWAAVTGEAPEAMLVVSRY